MLRSPTAFTTSGVAVSYASEKRDTSTLYRGR